MKKRTKFAKVFPIVISLVSILVATISVTWAWVAMNRQVDSNNVVMTIDSSPNLVISDSSTSIGTYTPGNWTDSYIVKTWSDSAQVLIPADHYDSTTYPTVSGTNTFGLVYNNNPEKVSRTTGIAADATNAPLTFAHVPSDGENTYFIDKTVYVASLEKTMTKGTDYSSLTFTITERGTGTTTNPSYKSASVDVYIDGTYKGTLNLDSLNTFSVTDVNTIPLNTLNTSNYLTITFRCYFDGALLNASSNAYVNSTALATNTTNIAFDISIIANS